MEYNVCVDIYGGDLTNNTWFSFPIFNIDLNIIPESDYLKAKFRGALLKFCNDCMVCTLHSHEGRKLEEISILLFYDRLYEEYKILFKIDRRALLEQIKLELIECIKWIENEVRNTY